MESEYENTYDVIVALLHRVDASGVNSNASSRSVVEEVDPYERAAKLPKLDLPTFSGNHEDWENFCDLFISLVHNSSRLSDASKLQYLKSCLRGSASDLVKDVSITNANYSSTWRALKSRYFNPCLIVNNYINSFLELPYLQKESAVELRALIDKAQCIVRSLKNLGLPIEHWDIWLVHVLAKRLDPESRKLWESEVSVKVRKSTATVAGISDAEPAIMVYFKTYADFSEFLEQRAQALTMIQTDSKINTSQLSTSKLSVHSKRTFHASTMQNNNSTSRKCPFCSEQHYISSCSKFRDKSPHERRDIIRRLKLCFNCLNPHEIRNCQSKHNCLKCDSRHNTLLHNDTPDKTVTFVQKDDDKNKTNKKTEPEPSIKTLTDNLRSPKCLILLATAQIIVRGPGGNQCKIRALLDQGSEASFISESFVQLLGIKKRGVKIPISGLGSSELGFAKSTIHFSLHSIYDSNQIFETEALVLPRLTSCLPSKKLLDLDFSQFEGYQLADPGFFVPELVNVILGADIYGQLLKPRLQRFHSSKLIGQDTTLGWIISGPVQEKPP